MKAAMVLVMLAMLASVACDISDARLYIEGPDEIERDEVLFYDMVTTGVTPLLAIVTYRPYADLDKDGRGDWNERLYNEPFVAAADRFGVARAYFGMVSPEEHFKYHKMPIPKEITFIVNSSVYWSDPATAQGLATVKKTVTIKGD